MNTRIQLARYGLLIACFSCISKASENPFPQKNRTLVSQITSNGTLVWIPGGVVTMGSDDPSAYAPEKPAVQVTVDGFWMESTEVTNVQFQRFVEATGYLTVAERPISWEELKKQLPPNTPKLPEEELAPGSMVFVSPDRPVPLNDISAWWKWVKGANWRHPEGPGGDLSGRENHPVVHVAYEDALAYADWVGMRLPTEAEWEFAARGGLIGEKFAWGKEFTPGGTYLANTFQGNFPSKDEGKDGYRSTAPVRSFPANGYGAYDLIGNVWELTSDWYDALKHARTAGKVGKLDAGMNPCYNPSNPYAMERVIKGGSFLCASNYCTNYRPAARQGQAYDSGTSNVGFRLVSDQKPKVKKG
jgi:formylglycine-generating enzyme required for sulfatase activity